MGLYSTSVCSWVQPFFVEMSAKSKSLVLLSSAIQAYLDEGSSELSVSSMEYIDTALKEFRREIVVHYDVMPAATACSGVLLCVLQVSHTDDSQLSSADFGMPHYPSPFSNADIPTSPRSSS